jgi:hypothetical protein
MNSTAHAYLWEVARTVNNQQTRLAAAAIAHDHELLRVLGRLGNIGVPCRRGCVRAHSAIAVPLAGGANGLANGCDGRGGRLGALFPAQVVVVLCGCRLCRHDGQLCGG